MDRRHFKRGFTLSELMITIAILLVLLGLIVPGVTAFWRSMKITELDDTAREIYVAAQNTLTRLAINGEKPELKDGGAVEMTAPPSDFPETGLTWEPERFYYVYQDGETADVLLPLGAIDDTIRSGGYYVIEYDAVNAAVYSVFYAEKPLTDGEQKYPEVGAAAEFRRSRDARKVPMVGYYGGSGVEREDILRCKEPELSIINENFLELHISGAEADYTVTVTISDHNENSVTLTYPADPADPHKAQLKPGGTVGEFTLLLDSLDDGSRFNQLFTGDDYLTPGSDLNIQVCFSQEADGTGEPKLSTVAEISANSLFASRDYTAEQVTVAYARHLQNLEETVSKTEPIKNAKQTNNIQWPDGYTFVSIDNTGAELLRYEGGNHEIRALNGVNGLFSNAQGSADEHMDISGVRLVNSKIIFWPNDETCIGLLAGTTAYADISDCGVYFEASTNGDGTLNYKDYDDNSYINAGETIGGLVGKADNTSVTLSFAAVYKISGDKVAGLIGEAGSGCKISSCYADVDELAGSTRSALVGGTAPVEIEHCYAVVYPQGVNSQGVSEKVYIDFASTASTVKDSYYILYHPGEMRDTPEFYVCDNSGSWKTVTAEELAAMVDPVPGTEADSWVTLAPVHSHPYMQMLDGRNYPYPAIGPLDHYGSWPTDGRVTVSVQMKLTEDEEANGKEAGTVEIYEMGEDGKLSEEPVYRSADHMDTKVDTFRVRPDTVLVLKYSTEEGYEFVSLSENSLTYTQIDKDKGHTFTASSDKELVVLYRQTAYRLTCMDVEYEDLGWWESPPNGTYVAFTVDSILRPVNNQREGPVGTGTQVRVQVTVPDTWAVGEVYYIRKDTNETVTLARSDANGYRFEMPAANVELYVKFTTDKVFCNIEYYQMDTNGAYPTNATKTDTKTFGVGEVFNRSLMELLAEESRLTLSITDDDGTENVLYMERAEVEQNNTRKYSVSIQDGKVTEDPKNGYVTTNGDRNKTFTVRVYIARKSYQVKLVAGADIEAVDFGAVTADSGTTAEEQVYYGAKVTAAALALGNQPYTAWVAEPNKLKGSSNARYTFEMPSCDLTLTAYSIPGYSLVSLALYENGESWLLSSESRRENNVKVYLVSSVDGSTYPLDNMDSAEESYLVQAIVPDVDELKQGYYIAVSYGDDETFLEYYTQNGAYYAREPADRVDDRVMLTVREGEATGDLDFFSVTFYPNAQVYRGTVPEGGTYLKNHWLDVPGNVGLLRNDATHEKIFAGWRDIYASSNVEQAETYNGGDIFQVYRRTDFFAQWVAAMTVTYHDGNEKDGYADGGELPVDRGEYLTGGTVTIKAGSLWRTGYTFKGWKNGIEGTDVYEPGDTVVIQAGENLELYPVWEASDGAISFYDETEKRLTGTDYDFSGKKNGDTITAPDYTAQREGFRFLGWAASRSGPVLYKAGEEITINGDMRLFARVSDSAILITYMRENGSGNAYGQEIVGGGVEFYPYCKDAGAVTGWSTQPNGKGAFYPCDKTTNKSLRSASFTEDTTLYAVNGKVYNYQTQTWYNTLYAAVRNNATQSGNTLVVYRDTEEPGRITFNRNLFVMPFGNVALKWTGNNPAYTPNNNVEFKGCMYVANCTVEFGRSDIPGMEAMGAYESLTFDANKLSRVMAVGNNGVFHMYDGVALKNGDAGYGGGSISNGDGDSNARQYFGGGVYAGNGATFNMHGGTVSYCTAARGGGVYLFTGAKMQMGDMVRPENYSATAVYYEPYYDAAARAWFYRNATATMQNYKNFYVTAGNPQICYNEATCGDTRGSGGGLLMLNLKTNDLILYRGSIDNNETAGDGGGLVTDGENGQNSVLRVYEVDISHNKSDSRGGGLFQWEGTLEIYNCTFRQNYAAGDGGAVYGMMNGGQSSNINIYFGDVSYNTSGRNGGAIYLKNNDNDTYLGTVLTMTGGTMRDNKAAGSGGAVYMVLGSTFNLSGGMLYNNKGSVNEDVYLETNTAITVPDAAGLDLSHRGSGENRSRIQLACADPADGRVVVRYTQGAAAFKTADADEFAYVGTGGYSVNPDAAGSRLILGGKATKQTVVFDKNAADAVITSGAASVELDVGATVDATSLPEAKRPGYYLAGWALTPNATLEDYAFTYNTASSTWSGSYTVTADYSQRLYAQWKPCTVNFYLNTQAPDVSLKYNVAYGPKVTLIAPDPTKIKYNQDDYIFLGWATSADAKTPEYAYDIDKGAFTDSEITPEENLQLYAVWQNQSITITFDSNGGGMGNSQKVERGIAYVLPDNTALNITKPGFKFAGWSTIKDPAEGDKVYQAGETLPPLSEDITLFAQWTSDEGNSDPEPGSLKEQDSVVE